MRNALVCCLSLCLLGCRAASSESRSQPSSAAVREPAAMVQTPAAQAAPTRRVLEIEEDRSLERFLTVARVRGVVALLEDEAPAARCSDRALCARAFVPASTFKIPNSMIGLETGVIPDAEFSLAWDGVKRRMDAWNRDHTLRTAMRDSAVWYYQELARRVGRDRMQHWLNQLGYGNRQIGDQVDQFWLEGPMAIRPVEQLAFLRDFARARLPISARTRDIVLDITMLGELAGQPLHGKTGWAFPDSPNEIGWFVGFTRDGSRDKNRYVAVLLFGAPPDVDFFRVRRAVGEQALREG